MGINLEGAMIEIPKVMIVELWAKPTHVMGWFNSRLVKAWKFIFSTNGEERQRRNDGVDRPSVEGGSQLVVGFPNGCELTDGRALTEMGVATPDFPNTNPVQVEPE